MIIAERLGKIQPTLLGARCFRGAEAGGRSPVEGGLDVTKDHQVTGRVGLLEA
jgi:hypothetical protein